MVCDRHVWSVPKLQTVQNRPMDLKLHGCVKDTGSETLTSLSNQVPGLLNQKSYQEQKLAGPGWDTGRT